MRARRILASELRQVRRDGMLLALVLLSPALFLLFRFLVPLADEACLRWLSFDLAPYHSLVAMCVLGLAAEMVGMAFGLNLVEDRDAGIFEPVSVSPLRAGRWIGMKLAMAVAACFMEGLLLGPLAGIAVPGGPLLPALASASTAALIVLSLGVFAKNKVEALSMGKVLSLLDLGAPLAWFLPFPWTVPAALLPTVSVARCAFSSGAESAAWAAAGIAVNAGYCALLYAMFVRHRARA